MFKLANVFGNGLDRVRQGHIAQILHYVATHTSIGNWDIRCWSFGLPLILIAFEPAGESFHFCGLKLTNRHCLVRLQRPQSQTLRIKWDHYSIPFKVRTHTWLVKRFQKQDPEWHIAIKTRLSFIFFPHHRTPVPIPTELISLDSFIILLISCLMLLKFLSIDLHWF